MVLQLFFNSIISGSIFSVIALSFLIIYHITHFFHFSHAVLLTLSAYFVLLFKNLLGFNLHSSILLSIIFTIILSALVDIFIYRPLRHKNVSSMILLLASLGIYIVLQNTISLFFGDDTKSIRSGEVREGLEIFGARITPIQIVIICTSIMLVIAVSIFLQRTKIGKAMRAVANDPELANISGIDSDRIILWTFAISSGLAGIAGILVALDVDMTPTMGMNALMMGVVAMIIGGVGSIPGVALGALLLGFAQNFGVWYISSQWQDAISFGILLIFLMFRPQGFLGKKVKKTTI